MTLYEQVQNIHFDCCFKQEELSSEGTVADESKVVFVSGIVHNFGLHKDRLESHREEVKSILEKMPSQFHKGTGDGWSFLNLCHDKGHNQWGEHIHAETLFALASGLGMGKFTLPREMWDILPGGMPYIVFDVNGID